MSESIGKKVWVFPDGELPPPGDSALKGHESVIILNMSDQPASIHMTLYFVDSEPFDDIRLTVDAQRVRCLRMNNPDDLSGYRIPLEKQYAMKLASDVPVVVQYGRLDTRQANMAFYTTMGYSV